MVVSTYYTADMIRLSLLGLIAASAMAVLGAPDPITTSNIVELLSPQTLQSFFALSMNAQAAAVANAQKLGLTADDARTIAFSPDGEVKLRRQS